MKSLQNAQHICMICDDNYVMPTCVTIQSLIDSNFSNQKKVIHIVASALSAENESVFRQFERSDIIIDIVKQNAEEMFQGFHTFDENSICSASTAALLKFMLAELFPFLDKLLYLDGDLIIKGDLSPLFDVDISNVYAAAVVDSGSIYFKHEYVLKVEHYFNSGVMMLNLNNIREDKIVSKLCQTKQELNDVSLMDQNVFNLVFDQKVKFLPIKYNFMPVSLDRSDAKWNINEINNVYDTSYANKKELYADAVIIHYSSKDKPWKNLDGAYASEWISAYLKAPVKHDLVTCEKSSEQVAISVIMPCYNVENYIRETIESVLDQSFSNLELICLDDGSTDRTLQILREYENRNSSIKVIANTNHGQGYERNRGIEEASGKYIYYMDSDDLLHPRCFEKLYSCAEENRLDLIFFEGESFYESPKLEVQFPQYKGLYNRCAAYPKVYNGKDLYIRLRQCGDLIVSPCLQFVKRSYLLKEGIKFPELPLMEDNLYVFHVLLQAERVKVLGDVLFQRRVRKNSTMTAQREYERVQALTVIIQETLKEFLKYNEEDPLCSAIASHVRAYFYALKDVYEKLDGCLKIKLETNTNEIEQIMVAMALLFREENSCSKVINDKLKQAWEEKSEINRKLQITYGEKAERGIKIKQLEREKAERGIKIKQLEREKAERGIKIKELEKELKNSNVTFSLKIQFKFIKKLKRFILKMIGK